MSKGALEDAKLYYAQAVSTGYMTFDELCDEISEACALTSADIKAIMDRMNHVLDKNLKAGRIVQFGEIGNFRMTVGSSGSATIEDFNADTMLRKPKITFSPGSFLQNTRTLAKFERLTIKENQTEEPTEP